MKRIKMEEKILKWIKLENENVETSVLGLDGDFGTGKTTYITKVFDWGKIEKETKRKSIYINLLNLDLDDKFINNLIKIFNKSKQIKETIKEKLIDSANQVKNTIKNKLWLTIDAFDDIKTIENRMLNYEKNKEEFFNSCVLVLDDIERINPENILKTLGLINQLSYKYKKMKILVPYNSKVLNDILNNFFGVQNSKNNENYLQKYLGNSINFQVNYHELKGFIEKYIDDSIEVNQIGKSFLNLLAKANINWRDIILLIQFLENNYISLETFIQENGLILFDKEIFQNNMIAYKNSRYILLKEEEDYFGIYALREKMKLMNIQNFEYRELVKKLSNQNQWPEDIKKPNNFKETSEISNCLKLEQEIYSFFKKYHNL